MKAIKEAKKGGYISKTALGEGSFFALLSEFGLKKEEWAKLMEAIKEAKKDGYISDASLGEGSFWALLSKYGLKPVEWTKRMELIRKFKEVIGSALGEGFFWARLYDCSKAENMLSIMEAARKQNLETKIGRDDGEYNWKIAANDNNNQKEALELMKGAEGTAVFSCDGCDGCGNSVTAPSRLRDLCRHFWRDQSKKGVNGAKSHKNVTELVCWENFTVNAPLNLLFFEFTSSNTFFFHRRIQEEISLWIWSRQEELNQWRF